MARYFYNKGGYPIQIRVNKLNINTLKKTLITVTILIGLLSCSIVKKENIKFSVSETLIKLPVNEPSNIYSDIRNGNMETIQIDTILEEKLFHYQKKTKFSQHHLYVVVQNKDTLGAKYLSIIEHKQSDSIFCHTKMQLSNYSIRSFSIEDTIIKEITQYYKDPQYHRGTAELLRQATHSPIFPTVYQDSIVLNYKKQKLVYHWLGDAYGIMEPIDISQFKNATIKIADNDFTIFYKQFAQYVSNRDTASIKSNTLFPLLAKTMDYDEDGEEINSSVNISEDDFFQNYIFELEDAIYINNNTLESIVVPEYSCFTTNKLGEQQICEQSLVFNIGTQWGGKIVTFFFIKIDGVYKLAQYDSYSINHPGE